MTESKREGKEHEVRRPKSEVGEKKSEAGSPKSEVGEGREREAEGRFFKVDIHTHIIPEHMPQFSRKFGYGGFVNLEHHHSCKAKMMIDGKFFREIKSNCWDPQQRLHECDEHGVHVQVLSTIPVLFHYWAKPKDTLETAQFLNDHVAGVVQRNPKRFIGLATLPMQDPELGVGELERCVKELGLAGIEIGSHINEWNLNAPELWPVYEACERLGAAVFVHPWDMMGTSKMPDYWLPWLVGMPAETSLAICSMIFGGVFEKFPRLKVAFAHGGGSFPATIGRIEHGFEVRPDLCAVDNPVNPREYLGKFYVDSLVHDPHMLQYLVNLMGADKVCLGTDYPFVLGEHEPGKLIESIPFDDRTKQLLLGDSAMQWLGMERGKYF